MNHRPTKNPRRPATSYPWGTLLALAALILATAPSLRADNSRQPSPNGPGGSVHRDYTLQDRIRYQLWDYTWNPEPDEPITRIVVDIGRQRVYVYQDGHLAGQSPTTTGKPGYDTPPGHYKVMVKDIDHESNLYGVFEDAQGNVIDGDVRSSQKPPPGLVYDAADMPYYLRLRDDGVGLHGGYIPGTGPSSHGCIRLPQAFAELLFSNVSVGTPVDVVK